MLQLGGAAVATTLVAVVYDPASWSVPAPVHMAVAELRADGHEIRLVPADIENAVGKTPEELAQSIAAARAHGLPALVFHSGGRVAAADVPLDKDDFVRAVK
jgi:hypothetical protein